MAELNPNEGQARALATQFLVDLELLGYAGVVVVVDVVGEYHWSASVLAKDVTAMLLADEAKGLERDEKYCSSIAVKVPRG